MAAPEKHVINFMGDAAFGMAGLDIETAVRSEIPILTIILNNGVMTHYHENMPAATQVWNLDELSGDYSKVAEGLGAYAERVTDPDEVSPAVKRAIAANREGAARGTGGHDQGGGEGLQTVGRRALEPADG